MLDKMYQRCSKNELRELEVLRMRNTLNICHLRSFIIAFGLDSNL